MYICFSLFFLMCCHVNSFNVYGSTKPLGYFDPLGFAKNKPQHELVKLREAELKHCRWGMISAVAFPATELVTHEQAIHTLDHVDMVALSAFTTLAAASEFKSMLLGWENPFTNSSNFFMMKSDYQPGDLGLNLKKNFLGKDELFMSNAELNNGRLAMIGSLGMIAQELVSNKPIF
jgi:hypothetical protein